MKQLDRRTFLKTSGAAGLTAAAPFVSRAWGSSGPNDMVNVAVIGVRSRGAAHYKQFAKIPNVNVVTLCDVDERLFAKALKDLGGEKKVKTETDLRRVFDDKSVDAVAIATPDHWHALATVWACQAGKDVYVEKPASHTIWEGRQMVEAARKYNRVVAVGLQSRSNPAIQAAIKFLHEGGIGELHTARALCFKPRDTIGKKPDSPCPPGVNYDLWLGPARQRAFNENHFHYNWHWFWEYGCADIGNQGPHQMDIARWALGKHEYPQTIKCVGGRFAFDDDQETPNTQTATFEYAGGKLLEFGVRGLYTNAEGGITVGNLFYGTKGWMQLDDDGWKTFFGRKNEPGPSMVIRGGANPLNLAGSGDGGHFENFIQAVRARDAKLLNCDIEEGHRSTALCHLANISYRVRREVRFDGRAEKFVGDKDADALLTRQYRKPFVVPEKV
jgi:predicted dehydrogenase